MERNKLLLAIGNKIRKLRKDKGFSQENFAYEINMNRVYYGRIERGEQNLSSLNLIKISLALDVEVGELFPDKKEIILITSK